MKQKDLVRKLLDAGFKFHGHGANHDRYIRGNVIEQIPRHKEVNERLAKAILKKKRHQMMLNLLAIHPIDNYYEKRLSSVY